MLSSLNKRLGENGIEIKFTDAAIEKIADEGFDKVYGARPLRRAIQSDIEDMLAEKMLDGTVKNGDTITVEFKDDKFDITK